MAAADGTTGHAAPLDVAALPEGQGPADSESTFLRLQKQRPAPIPGSAAAATTSSRREGFARPSDIVVTEPAYEFHDPTAAPPPASADLTTSQSLRQAAMAPRRSSSPYAAGMSPRAALRSASPGHAQQQQHHHLSPATSQIFERDVQQESGAPGGPELSPAIPAHIQTEDHIPPVLEASSEVITNSRLDPEQVEIVTHAAHQPAVTGIAGGMGGGGGGEAAAASATASGPTSHAASVSDLGLSFASGAGAGGLGAEHAEEGGSSYGAVDMTDPRRLSFISFADVVHAEHVDASKEAAALASAGIGGGLGQHHGRASPSSLAGSLASARGASSPGPGSPARDRAAPLSPASIAEGVEPGEGSPSASPPQQHGDLTIKTLARTLESTASADLGPAVPSTPPPS